VAEDGLAVVDHDRARELAISADHLASLREQAGVTAATTARRLRSARPPRDIVGRTALLVGDGIATGDVTAAAARTARRRGAARLVLAVPVARATALARLGEELDEIVCIEVGPAVCWYERAPAVTEAEIVAALEHQARTRVPEGARGVIVMAAASETVRRALSAMRFATVEVPPGGADADSIATALQQVRATRATEHLAIGCFGLGETAEAALAAGARTDVRAVVAAGGRPDHAGSRLHDVTAATLIVVGGEDRHVLHLARDAGERLTAEHGLAVVAGATHDFAEPGALEQVAHYAATWFARHLTSEVTT
jgi:hypothetical protein